MLDPRTNTTIEGMAEALAACGSFAITGHVSPDGDCLGSQLALSAALRSLGKAVDVLLVEDAPVERGLRFLPGFDALVPAGRYDGMPEAFVCVDVSVRERIKAAADVMDRASRVFVIDHHAHPDIDADLVYDDPDAASCTMLVWDVAKAMGAQLTPELAMCAYAGLMTDTGRFQFQNTDAHAFRHAAEMVQAGANPSFAAQEFYENRSIASLSLERRLIERMEILHGGLCAFSYITLGDFAEFDAHSSDAEALIDTLRRVSGVRVACILKERDGFVRGSLRAKGEGIDVACAARSLGGGGHKAAAGFTLHTSLGQAIVQVKAQLDLLLGK